MKSSSPKKHWGGSGKKDKDEKELYSDVQSILQLLNTSTAEDAKPAELLKQSCENARVFLQLQCMEMKLKLNASRLQYDEVQTSI